MGLGGLWGVLLGFERSLETKRDRFDCILWSQREWKGKKERSQKGQKSCNVDGATGGDGPCCRCCDEERRHTAELTLDTTCGTWIKVRSTEYNGTCLAGVRLFYFAMGQYKLLLPRAESVDFVRLRFCELRPSLAVTFDLILDPADELSKNATRINASLIK